MMDKKIALVTGGNRGIGFAICRGLGKEGFHVLLGSRNLAKGKKAAATLCQEGLDVEAIALDVDKMGDIKKAMAYIKKKFKRLDVLINNAGVYLDVEKRNSVFLAKPQTIIKNIGTNAMAPMILTQLAVPLMKKTGSGRIVNMSSGMGQLIEMEGRSPAYRLSKLALNGLTKIFSEELKGTDILINCMCPGWVKTAMGGPNAERTPEEGADTAIYLATLPPGSPSGLFFQNRKVIPW